MMKAKIISNCLLCILLLGLLGTPCLAYNIEEQALASANTFAEIIDDSNFQAAYWSSSPLLRLVNDEQQWVETTERRQKVLGRVLERKVKHTRSANGPASFPDGNYRIILFDARTEHKAEAVEVVYVHQVDGLWQVCDYSIR